MWSNQFQFFGNYRQIKKLLGEKRGGAVTIDSTIWLFEDAEKGKEMWYKIIGHWKGYVCRKKIRMPMKYIHT